MTERDLTRVMTEHVADVHLPDEAVRRIRMAAKEEKPVKKKMSLAVAMVMILVLLASAAVAAEIGIFDFLSRKMGQTVLPGAEDIVQSDVAVAETEYATFYVRQAAYDGQSALIMVDVKPKRDNILLVDETCSPEEDRIALYLPEMEESTQTILEYANEHEQVIVYATMRNSFNGECMVIDSWDNGTLTLMMSFNATEAALPLTFDFTALPCNADGMWTGECAAASAEILLTAAAPLWQISSEQSFDLPEYGVRIDGVRITGTVLQSYWEVRYTVTDLEKVQNGGFRVGVLDAQGNALPRGVLGVSSSGLARHEGDELIWNGGFGAVTEAPTQVMLQVKDVHGVIAPAQLIFDLK